MKCEFHEGHRTWMRYLSKVIGYNREVTCNLHLNNNHRNRRITGLLKKLFHSFVQLLIKLFLCYVQFLETPFHIYRSTFSTGFLLKKNYTRQAISFQNKF